MKFILKKREKNMKRFWELILSIFAMVAAIAVIVVSAISLAGLNNKNETVASKMTRLMQNTSKRIDELNSSFASDYNKNVASSGTYSGSSNKNSTANNYNVSWEGSRPVTDILAYLQDDYIVWTISEYVNEFGEYEWLDKVFELSDMSYEHYYCQVTLNNSGLTYDDNRTVGGVVVTQDHVSLTYDYTANKPLTMNTRYYNHYEDGSIYVYESSIDFVKGTYVFYSVQFDKETDYQKIYQKDENHFKQHFDHGSYARLNFFDSKDFEHYGISVSNATDFDDFSYTDFIVEKYKNMNLVDVNQILDYENAPVYPQSKEAYNYCTGKYKMEVDENGKIVVKQSTGIDQLYFDAVELLNQTVYSGLKEESATIGKDLTYDGVDYREKLFCAQSNFMLNDNAMLKAINNFYEKAYDPNKTYYKTESFEGYDFTVSSDLLCIKKDFGDKLEMLLIKTWWSSLKFPRITYIVSESQKTTVVNLSKSYYEGINHSRYHTEFSVDEYKINYQNFKTLISSSEEVSLSSVEIISSKTIYISEGTGTASNYYNFITLNEDKRIVISIDFTNGLVKNSFSGDFSRPDGENVTNIHLKYLKSYI